MCNINSIYLKKVSLRLRQRLNITVIELDGFYLFDLINDKYLNWIPQKCTSSDVGTFCASCSILD
jgi:hypothetical protein